MIGIARAEVWHDRTTHKVLRRWRRPARPPSVPWTPEEDEKLREVNDIGLRVEYWQLALPERRESEMLNRRYELGLKPPRFL